jgi:hypothetical protein
VHGELWFHGRAPPGLCSDQLSDRDMSSLRSHGRFRHRPAGFGSRLREVFDVTGDGTVDELTHVRGDSRKPTGIGQIVEAHIRVWTHNLIQ